jgi:hypothetical protein
MQCLLYINLFCTASAHPESASNSASNEALNERSEIPNFLIQVVDMTLLLSLAEEEPEPSGDSCASEGVERNNQGKLSLPALELDGGGVDRLC